MEEQEQEQEQEQEKKDIVEWCIEHPKQFFALRAIVWTIFAAVLPFSFIAWRYDIFKKGSELQLSGWGIIAVIIVAVFAIILIRYVFLALKPGFYPGYSLKNVTKYYSFLLYIQKLHHIFVKNF